MTTKRTSKQAKPLDAGHSDELSRELSISRKGNGIAELAEQLADLENLCTIMDMVESKTETEIEKAIEAQTCGTEKHISLCRAHHHFEDMQRASCDMGQAVQQLILGLEPTTASETLSLALVYYNNFDPFLCNNVNREYREVNREIRKLERALKAIIRGLVRAGATSPILEVYVHADDLVPWQDARQTATREANYYRVEFDPTVGHLVTQPSVRQGRKEVEDGAS